MNSRIIKMSSSRNAKTNGGKGASNGKPNADYIPFSHEIAIKDIKTYFAFIGNITVSSKIYIHDSNGEIITNKKHEKVYYHEVSAQEKQKDGAILNLKINVRTNSLHPLSEYKYTFNVQLYTNDFGNEDIINLFGETNSLNLFGINMKYSEFTTKCSKTNTDRTHGVISFYVVNPDPKEVYKCAMAIIQKLNEMVGFTTYEPKKEYKAVAATNDYPKIILMKNADKKNKTEHSASESSSGSPSGYSLIVKSSLKSSVKANVTEDEPEHESEKANLPDVSVPSTTLVSLAKNIQALEAEIKNISIEQQNLPTQIQKIDDEVAELESKLKRLLEKKSTLSVRLEAVNVEKIQKEELHKETSDKLIIMLTTPQVKPEDEAEEKKFVPPSASNSWADD